MTVIKPEKNTAPSETASGYTPVVSVYFDSSCLSDRFPNISIGASAGCGAVIIDRNRGDINLVARYLHQRTNQRSVILAFVFALEQLRRPCRVELFSDSMYVIDTITGHNLIEANRGTWEWAMKQTAGHHITWKWAKACERLLLQEAASRLALAASTIRDDLHPDHLELLKKHFVLKKHFSDNDHQICMASFESDLHEFVRGYGIPVGPKPPPLPASLPSAFSDE